MVVLSSSAVAILLASIPFMVLLFIVFGTPALSIAYTIFSNGKLLAIIIGLFFAIKLFRK